MTIDHLVVRAHFGLFNVRGLPKAPFEYSRSLLAVMVSFHTVPTQHSNQHISWHFAMSFLACLSASINWASSPPYGDPWAVPSHSSPECLHHMASGLMKQPQSRSTSFPKTTLYCIYCALSLCMHSDQGHVQHSLLILLIIHCLFWYSLMEH